MLRKLKLKSWASILFEEWVVTQKVTEMGHKEHIPLRRLSIHRLQVEKVPKNLKIVVYIESSNRVFGKEISMLVKI